MSSTGARSPPSPLTLPVIGHLHLLSKYAKNPWQGFDKIREEFGDVVSLWLGSYKAVLVSSADGMREVLLTKGEIFCDRPFFHRYTLIFGGDRENCKLFCVRILVLLRSFY